MPALDTFSLDGHTALVTGAVSGIGRATAQRYAEAGAAVAVVDLDETAVTTVAGQIAEATGADVIGIAADVTDTASADAAVASTVDRLGGRLDVLCNIAGVLRFENTHEVSDDLWDFIIGVNLTGTFKMTRAALRVFLDQGSGSIVNTASSAAYRASAWASAYGASKAGVIGFTKTIAIEYGRKNIRCNAVAPAGVRTPMVDAVSFPDGADFSLVERIMAFDGELDPDDLAQTYVFLGSPAADRLNGETISVDDGMLA